MSILDDRKNASESKFVLNADQEFKASARRNKLLAQWAAPLVGRTDDLDEYVLEVIRSDFEEAGDDDVFRKLKADLEAASSDITDAVLRDKMAALLETARAQIFES
jgi:hypothetical protein